jgi:hypothetical protein
MVELRMKLNPQLAKTQRKRILRNCFAFKHEHYATPPALMRAGEDETGSLSSPQATLVGEGGEPKHPCLGVPLRLVFQLSS